MLNICHLREECHRLHLPFYVSSENETNNTTTKKEKGKTKGKTQVGKRAQGRKQAKREGIQVKLTSSLVAISCGFLSQ